MKPDEMVETRIDLSAALEGGFGNVIVDIEPTVKKDKYDRTRIFTWVQATQIGLDAFVDNTDLVGLAHVMQRYHIGMRERRRSPRLLLEPPQPLGLLREGGGEHLDRHLAPEARVLRAPDLAHAPFADRGSDLVVRDAHACSDLHWMT